MFNLTPTVRNLLIANIVLLGISSGLQQVPLIEYGAMFPFASQLFQPWQLITHMFLHAGWGHLIGNMFGLISFGPLLEQRWGSQRFLLFWLICGFGAGVLYQGVRAYELRPLAEMHQNIINNPTGGEFADFIRKTENTSLYAIDDLATAGALERSPNNPALREQVINRSQEIYESVLASPMLGASGALFGLLLDRKSVV